MKVSPDHSRHARRSRVDRWIRQAVGSNVILELAAVDERSTGAGVTTADLANLVFRQSGALTGALHV